MLYSYSYVTTMGVKGLIWTVVTAPVHRYTIYWASVFSAPVWGYPI